MITTGNLKAGVLICSIGDVDVLEFDDGSVRWTAGMMIDSDGAPGNPGNDPYWQPDTTLHHNGNPINANSVPYVVVPPAIIQGVKGIVLGCQAEIYNKATGNKTAAVVADVGPHKKIGEASMEAARRVGVNCSPTHGGTSEKLIEYTIYPGTPAVVDNVTYNLMSGAHIK